MKESYNIYNITISTITFAAAAISLIASCINLQNELQSRRELTLAKAGYPLFARTPEKIVSVSEDPDRVR